MIALTLDSGKLVWETRLENSSFHGDALIFDTIVYFPFDQQLDSSCEAGMVSLNIRNGAVVQQWLVPGTTDIGCGLTTDVLSDGKQVYSVSTSDSVYAFSPSQINPLWVFASQDSPSSGFWPSPPALYDSTVLFGSMDGAVSAINVEDGSVRWTLEGGARVTTPMHLYDKKCFFGTESGEVREINLRDRAVRVICNLGGVVFGRMLVDDSLLYTQVDGFQSQLNGRTCCIRMKDGSIKWSVLHEQQDPPTSKQLIFHDNFLVGGSGSGQLNFYHKQTGSVAYSAGVSSAVRSILVKGNLFLLGLLDGTVTVLDYHRQNIRE